MLPLSDDKSLPVNEEGGFDSIVSQSVYNVIRAFIGAVIEGQVQVRFLRNGFSLHGIRIEIA